MQLSSMQSRMRQAGMRQAGFGLVELMIGMVITLIILSAASTVLLASVTGNRDSIRMSRLDQGLRQVMTMVSRDLRRASAWDAAVDVTRVSLADPLTLSANAVGSATVTSTGGNLDDIGAKAIGGTLVYYDGTTVYKATINSFDSSANSYGVTILSPAWPAAVKTTNGVVKASWTILRPQSSITVSGNCILFNYDTDGSGTYTNYSSSPATPNEFFGYRYDSAQQAVETRGSSSDTCASTGWENLTDENTIAITDFSVTDNTSTENISPGFDVEVREYTISVTGNLKSDTSVVRTLQETIRVRNDRLS
jgi:prepilin-type N-terminal cleavage/methylation domain-containing protein